MNLRELMVNFPPDVSRLTTSDETVRLYWRILTSSMFHSINSFDGHSILVKVADGVTGKIMWQFNCDSVDEGLTGEELWEKYLGNIPPKGTVSFIGTGVDIYAPNLNLLDDRIQVTKIP